MIDAAPFFIAILAFILNMGNRSNQLGVVLFIYVYAVALAVHGIANHTGLSSIPDWSGKIFAVNLLIGLGFVTLLRALCKPSLLVVGLSITEFALCFNHMLSYWTLNTQQDAAYQLLWDTERFLIYSQWICLLVINDRILRIYNAGVRMVSDSRVDSREVASTNVHDDGC